MQKKVMKKIVILGISTMMGMILAQSEEYEAQQVEQKAEDAYKQGWRPSFATDNYNEN